MLKKTIVYRDHDSDELVSRDFYFNLTKAEALEINIMEDLETVSKSQDPRTIIPVFKNIIHYAYGVRLPNGKFTKDSAETTDFLASDAYSELFLELLGGGEEGVAGFIRQLVNVDTLPQDHKSAETPTTAPSAREVFAQSQAAAPLQGQGADPAEASPPVQNGPSGQSEVDDKSYQEFLKWKDSQKNEPTETISRPPHQSGA